MPGAVSYSTSSSNSTVTPSASLAAESVMCSAKNAVVDVSSGVEEAAASFRFALEAVVAAGPRRAAAGAECVRERAAVVPLAEESSVKLSQALEEARSLDDEEDTTVSSPVAQEDARLRSAAAGADEARAGRPAMELRTVVVARRSFMFSSRKTALRRLPAWSCTAAWRLESSDSEASSEARYCSRFAAVSTAGGACEVMSETRSSADSALMVETDEPGVAMDDDEAAADVVRVAAEEDILFSILFLL